MRDLVLHGIWGAESKCIAHQIIQPLERLLNKGR